MHFTRYVHTSEREHPHAIVLISSAAINGALRPCSPRYGMRSSMSRKGNCWDDAPTESLWGSLKVGRLYGKKFATQRAAMNEVIDWLTFYNHRRLRSTMGHVSPMRLEANWRPG